ncbi:NmrA family NAD(P)-binding protein [Micromonospora sp. M12]
MVTGDLDDRDSLVRAAHGARAVFSVQMPAMDGATINFDGELTQGVNLIESALEAKVPQFVHTSVSGAGQHTGRPAGPRAAGRPWRPTTPPRPPSRIGYARRASHTGRSSAGLLHGQPPSLGGLPVPRVSPAAWRPLSAADRTLPRRGRRHRPRGRRGIAEPDRFHRVELELASDHLTMTEIAEALSDALGTELAAPDMTEEEAVAAGMPVWAGISHEQMNVVGHPARPEYARDLGIPLTTFATWAREHLPEPSPAEAHGRRVTRRATGAGSLSAAAIICDNFVIANVGRRP